MARFQMSSRGRAPTYVALIVACCGGVIAGHLGYPLTGTAVSYGVATTGLWIFRRIGPRV